MAKRQPPVQQAPPAQRLRLRYAKRGPARFTSHRDFSRAFERALRRADIPMAYSSGFSPHPRISYANASPTGAATEAEYLELGLSVECDPAKVMDALNRALPPGMQVLAVQLATKVPFSDVLTASTWQIDVAGVEPEALHAAVDAMLAADEVLVERMTKTGMRTFDARQAVVSLSVTGPSQVTVVSLQQAPLVRPDDIVSALKLVEPRFAPISPALLTRVNQGPLVDGVVVDPFAPAL